ncbi:MAG: SDR family oxidoreductase [Bacteroidales bacterium]|nr:SDR family oxidoreductase [Bacteroidales bacterium]MBN2762005.1 SDR family oxidoreductase [Bacteroidales bacterium]
MPKTTVIITGASRGIGFEIAKCFARLGHFTLYALSRNKNGLGRLASECAGLNKTSKLFPVLFDFESFLKEPAGFMKSLPGKPRNISVLINNAGCLINKPFDQVKIEEAVQMLRVNFLGPAMLIKEMLPYMGRVGSTHIVNIGSMGGFQGSSKYPGLSYYSASKAALANITECLSMELKDRRVFCNCLALGAVQTEMFMKAFPGYKAPVKPKEIAGFICDFALNGHKFMNGKIIPVALSNP